MKECTKCKEVKGLEEFHKKKGMRDGHRNDCKMCHKENAKKHYRENKEKIFEQKRQYRQENKERINEISKKHYQENKEKVCERKRQYLQTERGQEVAYKSSMKRRSYKHKVRFTPHERKQILERDNYTCQCCGITVHDRRTGDWNTHDKAEIDHVIPIYLGGNSEPNNLQTLCRTCNRTKSNKLIV